MFSICPPFPINRCHSRSGPAQRPVGWCSARWGQPALLTAPPAPNNSALCRRTVPAQFPRLCLFSSPRSWKPPATRPRAGAAAPANKAARAGAPCARSPAPSAGRLPQIQQTWLISARNANQGANHRLPRQARCCGPGDRGQGQLGLGLARAMCHGVLVPCCMGCSVSQSACALLHGLQHAMGCLCPAAWGAHTLLWGEVYQPLFLCIIGK